MGVLALSSGESELAVVVRAATEGLGLQSILSDFDLCGHDATKKAHFADGDKMCRDQTACSRRVCFPTPDLIARLGVKYALKFNFR